WFKNKDGVSDPYDPHIFTTGAEKPVPGVVVLAHYVVGLGNVKGWPNLPPGPGGSNYGFVPGAKFSDIVWAEDPAVYTEYFSNLDAKPSVDIGNAGAGRPPGMDFQQWLDSYGVTNPDNPANIIDTNGNSVPNPQ